MRDLNIEWLTRAAEVQHLFHTRWLGERFFHLPGDMQAIQELVWRIRPDYIVQTGVAAGGGVLFSASMQMLASDTGRVLAIEPRLRDEVRQQLLQHRMAGRIDLIHAESCSAETLAEIRQRVSGKVLVILDLTHTQAHVERELDCYAGLVTPDSYIVVMDTIMEYLPAAMFEGKPYGRGNNPATAVQAFLARDRRFEVDHDIEDRVIMTLSPGGFLRRRP